jgi:hypothetical protein
MDQLRSQVKTHAFARGARWSGAALLVLLAASVALFASLNTSRMRPAPLANTFSSTEELGRAVVAAMRAGDIDRLRSMALTEAEFRTHVWPDLPAARTGGDVPFDFVWGSLHQRSEGYLHQTMSGLGEMSLTLRDVRFAGETSRYGDVIVHRDTQLVFASPDGAEKIVELFGSTIEQDGRVKVFSYVVD